MKKYAFTAICAVIFFVPSIAQSEAIPILDQIQSFLNQYYITEAAFLAMTISVTNAVVSLANVADKKVKIGISLAVTLLAALLGYFRHIGIFASMGIFDVIVFTFMKTFAGNGFYHWIKIFTGREDIENS